MPCGCVCAVGRKRHTHVRWECSAGAVEVHAYAESNVRTSPLDFVDGISTWIDYLAINVCRKYGEYACREALGQTRHFCRFYMDRTEREHIIRGFNVIDLCARTHI